MRFPTIDQYIETIVNPEGLFAHLESLRLERDTFGMPIFSSGNYGVVFKVDVRGVACALKCFTRDQTGRMEAYRAVSRYMSAMDSRYLVRYSLFDSELYVFDDYSDQGEYFPVVLMQWVQGVTMTRYIAENVALGNVQAITDLVKRFDELALWLMGQTFAHGDLKTDNIIVAPDGHLVLIDYDGIYLPEMQGDEARELGTYGFQHPKRDKNFFNKHIDDYSIVVIAASLRALAADLSLYQRFHNGDNVIFNVAAIGDGGCEAMKCAEIIAQDTGDVVLSRLLEVMHSATPVVDDLVSILDRRDLAAGGRYSFVGQCVEGLVMVRLNGCYGFVDEQFRMVVQAVWDDVGEVAEGLIAVKRGDKWGFIDTSGRVVVDCVFDEVDSFSEGKAAVAVDGQYGYIDQTGETVIPFRFDDAWGFYSARAAVKIDDQYGYIDDSGQIVIEPIYDLAYSFSEGFACVCLNQKYGYITPKGDVAMEIKYDYAGRYRNKVAYLEMDNKQFYMPINSAECADNNSR